MRKKNEIGQRVYELFIITVIITVGVFVGAITHQEESLTSTTVQAIGMEWETEQDDPVNEIKPSAILDWSKVIDPPPATTDHHWLADDPLYEGWRYKVNYSDPMWEVWQTVDGVVEKILYDEFEDHREFNTELAAKLFVEQLVIAHAVAISEAIGTNVPKIWTANYPTLVHTMADGRSPTITRLDSGEPIQLNGENINGWLGVECLDANGDVCVGYVYKTRGSIDKDLDYPEWDGFIKRIGY